MKFLLLTIGSHGDVHPFVGIGRALMARGHEVRLATNESFRPLVERAGLSFVHLGNQELFDQVQNDPDIWHARRGPGLVMKHLGETIRQVYDTTVEHGSKDTIVVGSSLCLGSRIACEKFDWPMASVHLSPLCIRSSTAMPVLPGNFNAGLVPRFLRQKFWEGADRWYIDPLLCPAVNALRAELGMQPVYRLQEAWWHAPQLTIGLWPAWFFPRQPDYPTQVRLAGFPWYDESDQIALDPELDKWLATKNAAERASGLPPLAGGIKGGGFGVELRKSADTPIAFTPGSAMRFGQQFFQAAVDACVRLNRRGLLLTRHTDHLPKHLPASVRHVDFAPFGTLLPRCSALVHHGGIGTTAQALRAGIPQVIMPMSHDQFDNAAICRKLGVSATLSRNKFTGRRLAKALRTLLTLKETAAACTGIATRAKQDQPIDTVAGLLEGIR